MACLKGEKQSLTIALVFNWQEYILKISALISIKNYIIRNWKSNKNKTQEEVKSAIKHKLISYLSAYNDNVYRKHINSCLIQIIRFEQFKELYQYFNDNLAKLNELIKQNQASVLTQPETINFLVTLKMALKSQQKHKISNNFQTMILPLLEPLLNSWDIITSTVSSDIKANQQEHLLGSGLRLSNLLDQIIIYALSCSNKHQEIYAK